MVRQPYNAFLMVLKMSRGDFLPPFLRYFFRLKAIAAMSMIL